jgi:hypothetical protein
METAHDVLLPDASRFSEVRRPDKAPIPAVRPCTGTAAGENERWGRDCRSVLKLNAWLGIPGADRNTFT